MVRNGMLTFESAGSDGASVSDFWCFPDLAEFLKEQSHWYPFDPFSSY